MRLRMNIIECDICPKYEMCCVKYYYLKENCPCHSCLVLPKCGNQLPSKNECQRRFLHGALTINLVFKKDTKNN